MIYLSSSLNHLPVEARNLLFNDGSKLRAPDIVILKEDSGVYTIVAVIEIKNYLDKIATNSAIGLLSQIRAGKRPSKEDYSKYAIFSFNGIFVKEETATRVKDFSNFKDNYLIITERGSKKTFDVVDLS